MLLRHSNANLEHKRTKNFQPKLPPIKEDQTLRVELGEYVPKLTDIPRSAQVVCLERASTPSVNVSCEVLFTLLVLF